jgi:hypothetical protein
MSPGSGLGPTSHARAFPRKKGPIRGIRTLHPNVPGPPLGTRTRPVYPTSNERFRRNGSDAMASQPSIRASHPAMDGSEMAV